MRNSSKILYKNIYYILMYAVEELRSNRLMEIDAEEFKALNDFYASIINTAMKYVLNSGVLQEYKKIESCSNKPRGKLDIAKSIQTGQYRNGKIYCRYFTLNIDNDINRVIKLAIRILLRYTKSIEKENVNNLKLVVSFLDRVSDILPNEIDFKSIDTTQMGIEHKTALYISKLIIEEFITKEDGNTSRLIEAEDEDRMFKVFQKFVLKYYTIKYESKYIKVSPKELGAKETANTIYNKYITDTTIENKKKNRVLIIDTKWYKEVLTERNKLQSNNQLQIEGYVNKYKEEFGDDDTRVTGILLYAKPNIAVDIEEIEQQVRRIGRQKEDCIRTKVIDLNQNFQEVTSKLDAIFKAYAE